MAKRQRSTTAADAAQPIDTAAEAALTSAAAALTAEASVPENTPENTPEASAPLAIEISPEAAAVINLTAALANTPESSPMRSVLVNALTDALGVQVMAEAEANRAIERQNEESAAVAAAAAYNLSDAVLDAALAAIERKYAPVVPEITPDAPVASEAVPEAIKRAPSDRTIAANAAAASDSGLSERSGVTLAAFDSDSGKLACTVNRRPNTRFSGMVALTPSGSGVANYADYDSLTRAIRAYLVNVKRWQVSPNDGQSVPEAKWLASRGRYIPGSGVKSALACFHSGAEIALYPDGKFRFAYPNTPGVKFLRTDNAAWQAFVGGTNSEQRAPVETHPNVDTTSAAAAPPTPPTSVALPNGTLARTARCQFCVARNIVGTPECAACGRAEWHIA